MEKPCCLGHGDMARYVHSWCLPLTLYDHREGLAWGNEGAEAGFASKACLRMKKGGSLHGV